jgi:hypothetical protein
MDTQGHVSPNEVRVALRSLYRSDLESNIQKALLGALADDLKPVDAKGRWRPSPLLILLLAMAFGLVAVFVYFSLGATR